MCNSPLLLVYTESRIVCNGPLLLVHTELGVGCNGSLLLVHTELKVVRNGPLLPVHPELGGVCNDSLLLVHRVSSSPLLPPLGRSWGWKSVHLACEKTKNPLPSEQLARPTHYILRQSLSCSAGFEFLLCSKVLLNLISSCLSFPNSWNHCVECVHTDRMQRKLEVGSSGPGLESSLLLTEI